MSDIVLKNITKRFGKSVAVDNLNLTIADGDFITLLGPSGCGKTTTLRMIAGLETPTEGEIWIDGKCVFSAEKGINVPPSKRDVGFLFQNYALWPHMTVYQNISFGLENMKWPKDRIRKKVDELLKMLKIEEFEKRYPSELSGGQQQRVAIARTLATEPKVLFMDEPLSNLDAKLRMDMRTELKRLHLETRSTFVYVTHDQLEAMTLSTKICLMKKGLLQQYAPPLTVYHSPANMFTADFVGNPSINLIEGVGSNINLDEIKIQVGDLNMLFCPESNSVSLSGNHKIVLGIRPEYVNIEADSALQASIYSTLPSGMETIVKIQLGDLILTSVVFQGKDFNVGETVGVEFTGERCVLFDAETEDYLALGRLEVIAG
ncbi:ABC transporter ATP-binding protein [Clostridium sp. AF18-27]|uniref:Carbohydrate ABC transporter ATP-binding protein, CUT1 family n=1 Tax=Enterocloster lavalensis TaxID=460384 RepID=A0A1I0HBC1_9FIRM|nr:MULTISPECIES: ABC transporter ATP-binding protein [Enterocloster]MCB6343298.1 ABC transporter ATP-binding protein [Enterocloster lavalensis]MDR3757562.1 ABC transporter ATP-binding protein [Enterocloster sp.]RHR44572.1 ABC transporter ATP-binding protein [Clostridium sp. AF18-27]SET80976.1 carbohydrate ABC transporter ATP-binding protein, CUT1 family [Enterocloster lavalensis]